MFSCHFEGRPAKVSNNEWRATRHFGGIRHRDLFQVPRHLENWHNPHRSPCAAAMAAILRFKQIEHLVQIMDQAGALSPPRAVRPTVPGP